MSSTGLATLRPPITRAHQSRAYLTAIDRKQINPILQQTAHQEVVANGFLGAGTQSLAQRRVAQNLHNPLRGLIDRFNQKAVLPVFDLSPDTANIAADHGG